VEGRRQTEKGKKESIWYMKEPYLTDDVYLRRLKRAGKTDAFISAKTGISIQEIEKRWKSIQKLEREGGENGLQELRGVSRILGEQVQLLGHTLKIFDAALADTYDPTEFRLLIQSCPSGEDLAGFLLRRSLILKPFSLPFPSSEPSGEEPGGKIPSRE
jgi:hypothetical protein